MANRDVSRSLTSSAYVGVLVLTLALCLTGAAAFSILVDPYGMFGMPRLRNVTALKVAAASRLRLSKTYRVALAHPATLVTGSSITNLGIDPDSASWRPEHRPVFNLGLDGATLAEQGRYFLNAMAVSHPRLVVLVTSFEDLMPQPSAGNAEDGAGQPERRTLDDGRPNPHFLLAYVKDLVSATISFRALSDSALTLVRQSGTLINYQTDSGFEVHAPEEVYAATQGARAAADKMNRTLARRMIVWSGHPSWSIEPLDAMIRAAREGGADVVVMIPPAQADMVEIRRQLGFADLVEAWRLALAQLVGTDAAALGGPDHVALWDFSGLSGYTTASPVGRSGASHDKDWFWDPAHFNPLLGSLLIRRIETGDPADLGIRIESTSEAASAAAFSEADHAWVEAHPSDVERIANLLQGTREALCRDEPVRCPQRTAQIASDSAEP